MLTYFVIMVYTNVATEIWDVKSLCLNSLGNIFSKVQIAVFQSTLFSEFSVRGFRIAAFGISREFPDTFYPGIHERFQRLRAGEYLSVACPEIFLLCGSRLGNRFEELSCVHCCIVWFVPRGGIAPPRPCRGLGRMRGLPNVAGADAAAGKKWMRPHAMEKEPSPVCVRTGTDLSVEVVVLPPVVVGRRWWRNVRAVSDERPDAHAERGAGRRSVPAESEKPYQGGLPVGLDHLAPREAVLFREIVEPAVLHHVYMSSSFVSSSRHLRFLRISIFLS